MWIGITIGVFFTGLGISFAVFSGPVYPGNMMTNQDMMMQDPEAMQTWMQNPQHIQEMKQMMQGNHDFAMEIIYTIIEDPSIRLQMLGHMTENQDTMQQMMDMMDSRMMMSGMQGMMNQEMMLEMMKDPETKEKMLQIVSKHVEEMKKLLSSELTEDEFNMQMTQMMQSHMNEMQDLISNHLTHESMN